MFINYFGDIGGDKVYVNQHDTVFDLQLVLIRQLFVSCFSSLLLSILM